MVLRGGQRVTQEYPLFHACLPHQVFTYSHTLSRHTHAHLFIFPLRCRFFEWLDSAEEEGEEEGEEEEDLGERPDNRRKGL